MANYKMSRSQKGFKAEWWEGGRHRSRTFPTEEERRKFVRGRERATRDLSDMRKSAQRAGDYVARFSRLSVEDQSAILGAWECILAAGGGAREIREAADVKAGQMGCGVTVGEAIDAHVEDVRRTRRPGTAKDRAWQLKSLKEELGERRLVELTKGVCREWIAKGETTSAMAHRHGALSALLRDCVRREWLQTNPMDGFKKPDAGKREDVAIFSAAEAERLLRAAEEKEPGLVPFFAIGLFAGLRPQRELRELLGKDVDLDGGMIYVRCGLTKTGQNRSVPISGNLRVWLERYPVGEKVEWNRYAHDRVVDAAKATWSPDVMRHTRASYRLAQTRDPARTADEMGHDVSVLKRHYANRRIPGAEVERFWGILPTGWKEKEKRRGKGR